MKTIKPLLILMLYIFGVPCAFAEDICPKKPPIQNNGDELRMLEDDFTFKKASSSISWLENDIWDVIRSRKTTQDLLMSTEQFGIPFPNSVSIVKGALYKQKALLEMKNLELLKLKKELGKATENDIKDAKLSVNSAITEFCNILNKAEYVD